MLRRFIMIALTVLALTVGASAQPAAAKAAGKAAADVKTARAKATEAKAAATSLIDINSAKAEELDALPGIGKAYSQKIIAGRPYANKTQLVSKGVLPQKVYDKISAKVIAKQK